MITFIIYFPRVILGCIGYLIGLFAAPIIWGMQRAIQDLKRFDEKEKHKHEHD